MGLSSNIMKLAQVGANGLHKLGFTLSKSRSITMKIGWFFNKITK